MENTGIKVYGIIEGPISTYDYPMWEEGPGWVVVCQVEQLNGSLAEEEILFDTFDEAYELVKWFKNQCVPYTVWDYV